MSNVLQTFLNMDREQQLLQSFLRVGFNSDGDESNEESKISRWRQSNKSQHNQRRTIKVVTNQRNQRKPMKNAAAVEEDESSADKIAPKMNRIESELRAARKKSEDQQLKKKKPRQNFVDFYTDKDRAAAVSAGLFDIKQSLQIKQKLDRNEALQIPDEADMSSIIAQGLKELKNGNPENSLQFFSKALELNSTDLNALVSRSKCHLLLGEASKALQDAEAALATEKNNIRAIYQKAESLYYLGQFEQSLMFFHRGLRARPELASFRLGVQKTQEAIENTIGGQHRISSMLKTKGQKSAGENTPKSLQSSSRTGVRRGPKPTKAELERRNARKLLGELWVDKEYLEKLLKHPDLVRADTKTENVSVYAREAVEFLNKRQEFWRQQRACTALPNHKNLPQDALPKWF